MKKGKRLSGLLLISLLALYCSTVPISGRQQMTLIPESQLVAMSGQQYMEFMKTVRLSRNRGQAETIRAVGQRLRSAVEQYAALHNLSSQFSSYKWEFNLVESEEINAWAMPGGKVVFYTGILPLTANEAGIAVVMGHEIAHVMARHGNERMSQGLLVQFGGMALYTALQDRPLETQQLWMTVFGVGAQLGIMLPYSRLHEKEADRLGMIIMAMAGYDPGAALEFWQRMSTLNKGERPPEFLSTHPSDSTRIRLIKKNIPEAMQYYRR
jgi:predicted Zn-dependent protease